MKKLCSLVFLVCFVLLQSVTVSAQSEQIELCVRNTGSKGSYIDVYLNMDAQVFGGEFTLSFSSSAVSLGDIDSELFEIDAFEYDGKVKIALASDEVVKLSGDTLAFSVKLKVGTKEAFDIKLKVDYLLDEEFCNVSFKNNSATLRVDAKTLLDSVENDKKSEKSKSADKSKITTKQNETDASKDNSAVSVSSNNKSFGLIVAICLLFVVAFVFGLVFKDYLRDKP